MTKRPRLITNDSDITSSFATVKDAVLAICADNMWRQNDGVVHYPYLTGSSPKIGYAELAEFDLVARVMVAFDMVTTLPSGMYVVASSSLPHSQERDMTLLGVLKRGSSLAGHIEGSLRVIDEAGWDEGVRIYQKVWDADVALFAYRNGIDGGLLDSLVGNSHDTA